MRGGNDQARLIENHGPRRRAVPSPHRVTEAGPSDLDLLQEEKTRNGI